ncbi:MAG: hypothetical protein NZ874_07305 [Fimbriimonadales bacterium]|nr:hypothetical protein [Fimbriimonadales bacterium]
MKKETQIALAVAVIVLVIAVVALLFVFSGGGGEDMASSPSPQPPAYDRDTGLPMPPPTGGGLTPAPAAPVPSQQATRAPFKPRRDPFAPLPEEVEAMQADAFDPSRYFVLASPPKPPRVELPEPYEPQPRRRVAGVIIGTTVSAILEQEGELPRIVYPGDMVGEFRVVSITENGVVLRRPKGNPREVRVPLEPAGNLSGASGTGGGGAGRAPGAPPSAPGLGVPGGRGGGGRGPEF